VREKAIENSRGRRHIAEKDTPILRGTIGRNEGRRGFVAPDKDLEEVLGRIRGELLHPEVFQDE
jgi:hypothetical protein